MPNKQNAYGTPNLKKSAMMPKITKNPQIKDVEAEFKRISQQGANLAAHDGDLFVKERKFRYTHINVPGVNEARNHLQGMQRLRKGKFMVISGGDVTEPVSHLFVVRMGSRKAKGAWSSNLSQSLHPPGNDKIVRTIPLDKNRWHAGGVSRSGDILAVPLENKKKKKSKIIFLDMSDPVNPLLLDCEIDRLNLTKAGAVALGKLSSGKFLCAVWREVKKKPKGRLDFYVSRSTDIIQGFEEKKVTWNYGSLKSKSKRDPSYQNINFVEPEEPGNTPGMTRLYMVATENTAFAAPILHGKNLADLYEVRIPDDIIISPGKIPQLKRIRSRQFSCDREFGNLDAAGGIYIGRDKLMHLYTGFHWRVLETVRFVEFSSAPAASSP